MITIVGNPSGGGVFVQAPPSIAEAVESIASGTTENDGSGAHAIRQVGVVLQPIEAISYSFTGTFETEAGGQYVVGDIVGDLDIRMNQSGLVAQGVVVAGELVVDFGGGALATLAVELDTANTLVTDDTGQGWLTARFVSSHSVESWSAIMPGRMQLRVPVTIDAGGVIHADTSTTPWEDYYTPRMRPCTDFNLDGSLDFASDFAAFLEAHAVNDPGTDIDTDGAWTQADINLWVVHFDEDRRNHGG